MSALQPSTVLATSGPLRWKSQANGVPKVQGVFTMRDEQGFPLDMSYEIAREKGWSIDWLEAMADAARQCILKLDALLAEMRLLLPMAEVELWERLFRYSIMSAEGVTLQEKAGALYREMWKEQESK